MFIEMFAHTFYHVTSWSRVARYTSNLKRTQKKEQTVNVLLRRQRVF